jgi:hypothetical protein
MFLSVPPRQLTREFIIPATSADHEPAFAEALALQEGAARNTVSEGFSPPLMIMWYT